MAHRYTLAAFGLGATDATGSASVTKQILIKHNHILQMIDMSNMQQIWNIFKPPSQPDQGKPLSAVAPPGASGSWKHSAEER